MSLDLPDTLVRLISDKRVDTCNKRIKELEKENKVLKKTLSSADDAIYSINKMTSHDDYIDQIYKCLVCGDYVLASDQRCIDCECPINGMSESLCDSCYETNLYHSQCEKCDHISCIKCNYKCWCE